jgi:hypothetical protein
VNEERITWLSQKAYSLCIIGIGIQQIGFGEISDNFFPSAFATNIIYQILAYPWAIAFTLSGIAMLFNKKAFEISLISAGLFLTLFIIGQVPYMLFVSTHGNSLLYWAPALESLAFTGASLAYANSFQVNTDRSSSVIQWLEKLIPFAGAFFSCMLVGFGLDHFIYIKFVSAMVPSWIPGHYFWTYFTGTALIGAGIALTFKIKLRLVASLLGIMIFTWFIILHIPRAIANPGGAKGLELARVFVTIGFSGIAFLFALSDKKKSWT